ncbi:neural cell adhesion molecule L1.1-like [Boleophthalmus pectinirostris]|uniref:neural cell adhesion molecule L1.1-like n=1 Tax=Boleophthalmus pectinirostris TaxID=150288 RepID=UPI002432FA8B|nr:neural cell adhesion molecule L1.1-like [Boleophthalmus pectinirostris]
MRRKLYWYKQNLENTLRMTSSYFDKSEFYNEFKNNDRFKLDNKDGNNNLEITNVQISDSAVYHCICVGHHIHFLMNVYVTIKNFSAGLWINQMALETVKPGISLVLNCKVHFGTCAGQYRVHWFKQSEESAAGVLYSHGGSSDQCDNNTNTSTNSCVYSLPIHNVSSEQTGTYYCAVDACGQVLFGNGTRVNMKS